MKPTEVVKIVPKIPENDNPIETVGQISSRNLVENDLFTGVARSVMCYTDTSTYIHFPLYKIVTLHIVKGKVVKTYTSDAWVLPECMGFLEYVTEEASLDLSSKHKHGDAWAT